MTRDEAIGTVKASVARGTGTPIFEEDRPAAVTKLSASLEADVIEPIAATIHGIAYNDTGLAEALARETPFVIARAGDNWLGYLASSGKFFLAYGPEPSKLNALGFYSTDALAEWRG